MRSGGRVLPSGRVPFIASRAPPGTRPAASAQCPCPAWSSHSQTQASQAARPPDERLSGLASPRRAISPAESCFNQPPTKSAFSRCETPRARNRPARQRNVTSQVPEAGEFVYGLRARTSGVADPPFASSLSFCARPALSGIIVPPPPLQRMAAATRLASG